VTGQVFFATGTAQNPLRLFIQMDVKGKNAKLIVDNSFYGQFIASVLLNLPQTPFTSFALSFNGGPNALVTTPPCGTHPGVGWFFPWSNTGMVPVVSNVTISQTSTGAPCPISGASDVQQRSLARDLARVQGRAMTAHQLRRALDRVFARHGLHRSRRIPLAR